MNQSNPNLTLSLERLRAGVAPNITFVVLGIFAITLNLFIIFCVIKSKSLHTKCFVLLSVNAFVDFFFGLSYGIVGATRLYRFYSGIGEVITMWRCCWEVSTITYAQMVSLSMSTVLVVDRLTATLIPHKYKKFGYKNFTIPLIVVGFLFALAQSCVHFNDSWIGRQDIVFTCGIEDTISANNLKILIGIQIANSVIVVILNIILGIFVRKQNKKLQNSQFQNPTRYKQTEKEKNELKIFKTITVIVVLHILTHMGGRIVLGIVTTLVKDVQTQSLTSRYTRMLVVLNATIHFLILFSTSGQFRNAVKGIVKKNAVTTHTS